MKKAHDMVEGKAEGGGKYTNIHVWVYQEGGEEGEGGRGGSEGGREA